MTPLPVIGVPVKSSMLSGNDSLLSIVQMPKVCSFAWQYPAFSTCPRGAQGGCALPRPLTVPPARENNRASLSRRSPSTTPPTPACSPLASSVPAPACSSTRCRCRPPPSPSSPLAHGLAASVRCEPRAGEEGRALPGGASVGDAHAVLPPYPLLRRQAFLDRQEDEVLAKGDKLEKLGYQAYLDQKK